MSAAAHLHTRRLSLEPFSAADAEELLGLFVDREVRRYLLDGMVVTADWVTAEIDASTARFLESGCGLWSVRPSGEPSIVGFAGYRPFFDPPELQLLYGLLPSHWGRGLATEAASAVIDHGFVTLGLDEIRAAIDAPNIASRRVLERLGMREVERRGDDGAETVFFTLRGDAWNGAPARV